MKLIQLGAELFASELSGIAPVHIDARHQVAGTDRRLVAVAGMIHNAAGRNRRVGHVTARASLGCEVVRMVFDTRGVLPRDQFTVRYAESSLIILITRDQSFERGEATVAETRVQSRRSDGHCQSVAWFKRYKTLKSVTVGSLNSRKFSYSAKTRSAFGLARNKYWGI